MDDFTSKISLREALECYIFLQDKEPELPRGALILFGQLQQYLYQRMSIEEMENPERLLSRLQ